MPVRTFYSVVLCVTAVFGAATIAEAQSAQQSPANAHLFLTELSAQGRINFEPPEYVTRSKSYGFNGYNGTYTLSSDVYTTKMAPQVLQLAKSSGCQTTAQPLFIAGEPYSQAASEYSNSARSSIPGRETWLPFVPHIRHFNSTGINWAIVTSVATDNANSVIIQSTGFSGGFIKMVFDSPDMATRGTYAMEVIRQSCDPVAKTGF